MQLTGKNFERAVFAQADIGELTKPQEQFIGQGKVTKRLYELEAKRTDAIRKCAWEWALLNQLDPSDQAIYWRRAIPQALFDTLNSYSTATGVIAAEAFLEMLGYEITRPKLEMPQ